MTRFQSIFRNTILFCFAITLLTFVSSGTVPFPLPPHLAPPHPRLEKQIKSGGSQLPRILTDPVLAQASGVNRIPRAPRAPTATLNTLAVAVDFSDKVGIAPPSFFDTLLFAPPVAGRGSVRDYYSEVSYNTVDIVGLSADLPGTRGWVRAPQTYSYYVNDNYCLDGTYPNNCRKLAEDVVDAMETAGVNFANYDNDGNGVTEPIVIIHSGRGAEFSNSNTDAWSHARSLATPRNYDGVTIQSYILVPEYWVSVSSSTSDLTIGIIAHEMGHGFWGLPDLYDTDYSSWGIGAWSLMSFGTWNGPDSGGWGVDGSSPAWPDAWTMIKMGFTTSTLISTDMIAKNIPENLGNPPPAQTILKMSSPVMGSQEYFLVENRHKTANSYDEYLPGEGLLIWHIDDAKTDNNTECRLEPHSLCGSSHLWVALEQADGLRELEYAIGADGPGDPFPGITNNHAWMMTTNPESSSYYTTADTCIRVTQIGNAGSVMTANLLVSCGTANFFYFLPVISK